MGQFDNTPEARFIRPPFTPLTAAAQVRDGLPALYPRLWRFAVALTGSRTAGEDLAQAAALRALENADRYQKDTHLDRWLFTIARRLWLNDLRAASVRKAGGLVPIEEVDIPAPAPDTETNILAREVFTQVMALPEAQRITVLLVYVEGYAYREAAALLDIPIGTVMSRLAAARKTLTTSGKMQRRKSC